MSIVCISRDESIVSYPGSKERFRPSKRYPEYPDGGLISSEENRVYDLVRETFHLLGLDKDHYGVSVWNPLGNYIIPGDKVLIKPNLVLEKNLNPAGGEDCLYTHPSVVAPVIDYVLIALKGRGKIIIGDAPVQECRFDELIRASGYLDLIDYYKECGIDIEIKDFRNTKTYVRNGIRYDQVEGERLDLGVLVKLDEESAFFGLPEDHLSRLRVTNFDPRIMRRHHTHATHEYMIARDMLECDVIINMPKPKTHRKAGITGALKNLVGINASKEYLPHHTIGSKEEDGDAYKTTNKQLSEANGHLDSKNILVAEKKYDEASLEDNRYEEALRIGRNNQGERYWEGSWYGNDTIWRSISDLNKIVIYADKNGEMQTLAQRRYFAVGDMIISGEKEGPLWPSPKLVGAIIASEDPIVFDRAVCSVMGFDYRLIHPLQGEKISDGKYGLEKPKNNQIVSNFDCWNNCSFDQIRKDKSLLFQPTKGWEYLLGNPIKDKMISEIIKEKKPVIIFGAGAMGIDFAEYLIEKNSTINILGFYDNNQTKWGSKIVQNIFCLEPLSQNDGSICIIAANRNNADAIRKDVDKYSFAKVFTWTD